MSSTNLPLLTKMGPNIIILSTTVQTQQPLKKYLSRKRAQFQNQCNLGPRNIDRHLGIKIVIPEYDEKMQLKTFMDWLACMDHVFSYKPRAGDHKLTVVATRCHGYAAMWWTKLQKQ